MLCSICHKNMAVIFTKKVNGDKSQVEGYCYNCAKEKGINPLDVLAKQANLSEDEIKDMSKQFENIFEDLSQNMDIDELNAEEINSEGGIPLGSIFSNIFGAKETNSEGKEDASGGRAAEGTAGSEEGPGG